MVPVVPDVVPVVPDVVPVVPDVVPDVVSDVVPVVPDVVPQHRMSRIFLTQSLLVWFLGLTCGSRCGSFVVPVVPDVVSNIGWAGFF